MKLEARLRIERPKGARTRILDPRSGGVFVLDEVADEIVRAIERGTPRKALLAHLCELYDAPAWVLAVDLDTFLSTLEFHGLLRK
ncbi:MAG: PqqD family protein [Planctomycetes bacterium]|nr:PqqD family protein [Planctomycetota bacterium]